MAIDFNLNTDNEEEWLTPQGLIRALGEFDLDPCTQPESRRVYSTAKKHYSLEENGNGLILDWVGRVWLNPPYGRKTFLWLEKLAEHKSGIALIFARTETKGFHAQVFQKANAIFFFEGRLTFARKDGSVDQPANAPSCLVSYSFTDSDAIRLASARGDIKGRLVELDIAF